MPKRKRTAPVDARISRSKLGNGVGPDEQQRLLEDQLHQKDPRSLPKVLEKEENEPTPASPVQIEASPKKATPPPILPPKKLENSPAPKVSNSIPTASSKAEDAPFVPPESESSEDEEAFVEADTTPQEIPAQPAPAIESVPAPVAYSSPLPVSTATRTSRVSLDATPQDAPFSIPEEIDENKPLVTQTNLGRSTTAEKASPLSRSGRVMRGPRPLSGSGPIATSGIA